MAFGAWIRSEREQAGISLKDFAKSIDISQAYWSRIERGLELAPKDSLIVAACERLGLPTDQAFIQAQRLPPDMQADIAAAVSAYRDFKSRSAA
jgi:HTH-type transcriptional regulator, competence development regulator